MAEYTLTVDKTGDVRMDAVAKRERYEELLPQIEAVLAEEEDLLASMASLVCILHNAFPYFFWTGFYRRVGAEDLLVGPYQGTLGCQRIHFSRGVCGAAAREERTLLVPDVAQFPGHIACDAASASEIVVPVFDAGGALIGVLDVDSTALDAFDETDREYLERIVGLLRPKRSLPVVHRG